jgi:hypothetical protein
MAADGGWWRLMAAVMATDGGWWRLMAADGV